MMPLAIEAAVPNASTNCARRELERGADAGRRPHGAEHRGRMKSGLVSERRRDEAEPAQVSTPTAMPSSAARPSSL